MCKSSAWPRSCARSAVSGSPCSSASATSPSARPRSANRRLSARPTSSAGSGGNSSTLTASATPPPMIASRKRSGGKPVPAPGQRRDQDRRDGRLGDQQLAAAERDRRAHREHDHHARLPRAGADRGHDQVGDRDPEAHAADELERALAALADRRAERDHRRDRREQRLVARRAARARGTTPRRRRPRSAGSATCGRAGAGGRASSGGTPGSYADRSMLRGPARPGWLALWQGRPSPSQSRRRPSAWGWLVTVSAVPGRGRAPHARRLVAGRGRDERRLLRRARLGQRDHAGPRRGRRRDRGRRRPPGDRDPAHRPVRLRPPRGEPRATPAAAS